MYKVWLCAYDHKRTSASLERRRSGLQDDGLTAQGASGQDALEKALNWLTAQRERIVSILPLDGQMMTGPYAYIITEPIEEAVKLDSGDVAGPPIRKGLFG